MNVGGLFRPGMRAYLIPFVAGLVLALSAFLPWVRVGNVTLTGVPEMTGVWIAVLGGCSAVLATLSLITRKNSRHPLLLVGLVALGLVFLSWRLMPRAVADRAMTRSQAIAIVESTPIGAPPTAEVGIGLYLGFAAALAIAGFGLTIVVKRASQPWAAVDPDDDIS